MPTYDYQCVSDDCGHTFEKFESIRAKPSGKCPVCGKRAKRKIGAGAGLIFRGSGFYITDYRSKEYNDKAKADKAPTSSSTSSDNPSKKKEEPTVSAAS